MSPSSATSVAAATSAMPRSACNACTTGASDHSGSAALMYASRRSRRAVAASTAAILQHDVMHRLLELQSGQPASMDQCPGWPVVVMAVAQQEAAQLLTGLTQAAHRRQTRTQEIADSLMGRIWNPDRGQFTGPVQLGEVGRVPPVSLDPVTGLARDQRRSDDDASMSCRC